MSKNKVSYIKQDEPSFIKKFKQQIGYVEDPGIDAKVRLQTLDTTNPMAHANCSVVVDVCIIARLCGLEIANTKSKAQRQSQRRCSGGLWMTQSLNCQTAYSYGYDCMNTHSLPFNSL